MAKEEMNKDLPAEIHEYLSAFQNSIGAVDDRLATMMSISGNELLQKLDPLEQAKVDLVSAYMLNSMFWVCLATHGVNPKEHPVKRELERIRVYMNRVKEMTDKGKAAKLDRCAASRFIKNACWEPKPENAAKVACKGKSKNYLLVLMYTCSKTEAKSSGSQKQWFSRCGPGISSKGSIWEVVRNANSWPHPILTALEALLEEPSNRVLTSPANASAAC
ncbi:nuclear nucleic acid-binding protein C1D-like [Myotis daubentonii]|uniref:nuclear nucleic acid-binding protein C1D-like n=1 Tax=Myotis daubentonii TaxID=98922 RepID=UPI002872E1A8|nr:nuclear nucleic acid-binding protein C1D-like [Myotis daubentonii]